MNLCPKCMYHEVDDVDKWIADGHKHEGCLGSPEKHLVAERDRLRSALAACEAERDALREVSRATVREWFAEHKEEAIGIIGDVNGELERERDAAMKRLRVCVEALEGIEHDNCKPFQEPYAHCLYGSETCNIAREALKKVKI